ncbi:MAG: nitroreductase family protein [Sandaracinaceae bacterium]|nr:nitroreductase family protein [Sandaracinaceae bacterium]
MARVPGLGSRARPCARGHAQRVRRRALRGDGAPHRQLCRRLPQAAGGLRGGDVRQDGHRPRRQAGRLDAHARNFALFDAPHVAIVCMDRSFGIGVALDVGMWVQTFMLALTSRGVSSCPQAALRAYSGLLQAELEIPDNELVLCGVSFGYEDESVPVNACRQPRDPISSNVFRRG